MKPRLLLVDDDSAFRNDFTTYFSSAYDVICVPGGEEALGYLKDDMPEMVLLDVDMPGMDGIEVLTRVREEEALLPIIMLTRLADDRLIAEAMRTGADSYVTKKAGFELVAEVIRSVLNYREAKVVVTRRQQELSSGKSRLIGKSEVMKKLRAMIRKAAPTGADVLITGESGTGKELVALEIHRQSGRAEKQFLPVSICDLSEKLFESQLFGHVKGAFTGADQDHIGFFEEVGEGTLFLDEIAEVPTQIQAKLLRVLDTREYRRVGSSKVRRSRARVVAATNVDLDEARKRREFRDDLYHRLNVVRLNVPRLSERKEDIPLLARHFVHEHLSTVESTAEGVSDEACSYLASLDWPGHVRELRHAILRALIMTDKPMLEQEDFEVFYGEDATPDLYHLPYDAARQKALDEFRREYISKKLASTKGNVDAAARSSGLIPSSLRRMIRELGIDRREFSG
jgi:two-component system NtrC family response regulator